MRACWAWRYSVMDTWLHGAAGDPAQVAYAKLLWQFAQLREKRRIADGAWLLYKSEVDVRAPRFGAVRILDASQSSPARRVVTEAMIAAGVAAGQLGRYLPPHYAKPQTGMVASALFAGRVVLLGHHLQPAQGAPSGWLRSAAIHRGVGAVAANPSRLAD